MPKNRIGFGTNLTLVDSKIGIGTTNPLNDFNVFGNVLISAGASTGQHITISPHTVNNGTLSFEGSAGQLFSITNNLTSGSIFSVNDVSGIPSIDVNANGTISLGAYGGSVSIGKTFPEHTLDVRGNVTATGFNQGPFNIGITTAAYFSVTETLDSAVGFASTSGYRYLIHSIHLVNTSAGAVGVTARMDYSGGTNTFMGNQIPIESGGALELLTQPIVANPSDILRLQGFNDNGDPVSGAIDAFISYQPIYGDSDYVGVGYTITSTQTGYAHTLYTSTTYPTVIQSLRVCNISTISDHNVSLDWANSLDTRRVYIAYNLTVPQNSTIEIFDMPKNIYVGDKIRINVGVSSVIFTQFSGKLITDN